MASTAASADVDLYTLCFERVTSVFVSAELEAGAGRFVLQFYNNASGIDERARRAGVFELVGEPVERTSCGFRGRPRCAAERIRCGSGCRESSQAEEWVEKRGCKGPRRDATRDEGLAFEGRIEERGFQGEQGTVSERNAAGLAVQRSIEERDDERTRGITE